jgi:hypothetical protein
VAAYSRLKNAALYDVYLDRYRVGVTDIRFLKRLKTKYIGKYFAVHAMRAYRRIRGITPLIPNLGSRWR